MSKMSSLLYVFLKTPVAPLGPQAKLDGEQSDQPYNGLMHHPMGQTVVTHVVLKRLVATMARGRICQ
jgi:hypothetical protein